MENSEKNKVLFALLGKNIAYSFSRGYFTQKFKDLELDNYQYVNFDMQNIEELPKTIEKNQGELLGMNVTIPYKQDVFQYLDELDVTAKEIGAVNTIKVCKGGALKGFNTDYYGFQKSIEPFIKPTHKRALILGTGGASKAVAYALKELNIAYQFVSRRPKDASTISYQDLNVSILKSHTVIINCTPLGTHPNISDHPDIDYNQLTEEHLLYDLIYNPSETTFLKKGKAKHAAIKNGLEMLELQAEKAWDIWIND